MRKFKKLAVGLALAPAAVFAEGEAADVSTAVTQLQTAATSAVGAVKPAVIAIAVALFGIAAIWFGYRQIRKVLGR